MHVWILTFVLLSVAACTSNDSASRSVPTPRTMEESQPSMTLPLTLRDVGLPSTAAPPTMDAVPTPSAVQKPTATPATELRPATTSPTPQTAPPQPSNFTAAPAATSAAIPSQPSLRAPRGPTVSFFDVSHFDKQLSGAMSHGVTAVMVTFEAPASVNGIPERLNKWLSVIEKNGGTVELQPDPDYPAITQRGVFGIVPVVLGALAAIYEAIENTVLYGPAKGYNATVYYIRGSGVMTQVVFSRKPPQEGK